ncbi:MAG: hypothetical protein FD143_3341 [Ignavibacteria bacterium]|nr:MAG: hypothetical protein FD143_3341 [Ignavibacteria bacterium]
MSTEQFIVTLPSNSCKQTFPDNHPNLFKVQLPKALEFEGEWEVALMNIHYPFNWANYQEDYVAVFAKLKELETGLVKCTDYKLIKIPTGYYPNPGAIAKYVTNWFNKAPPNLRRGRKSWRLDCNYDPYLGKVDFVEHNILWYRFVTGSLRFHEAMGNQSTFINNKLYISFANNIIGPRVLLDKFESMHIYCDAIKYQICGDTQIPLLAVVPLQGRPMESCYWSCSPPYYLPLNQKSFNTIEIKVCTPTGEGFPFSKDGTVVVQLHFRRQRGPW